MTGEEQVEQEEDAEGDVEIAPDHVLHAGAQHLDHDLAALVGGAVHLAERGRGERLGVEPVEDGGRLIAQLRPDHPLGHARRQRGHLVGQRADGGEVGLGQDVGPGGEDLGQLDEGGAEIGEGAGESRRSTSVALVVSPARAAEDDEAAAIAEKGEGEGEAAG